MRSTREGVLDIPGALPITPMESFRSGETGLLSLVTDAPARNPRRRRLATVYLGNQPLYATRRLDEAAARLKRMVELLQAYREDAIYLTQSCRIDGRLGLYAREIFNRSPYIRKLQKLGVGFSEESHAVLTDRRTFVSDSWGEFRPSFVIWLDFTDDPREVITKSKGLGAAILGNLRFGKMSPSELPNLIGALESAPMVSAGEPAAVVDHLRRSVLN